MATHPLAGKPTPANMIIDLGALLGAYHDQKPDPDNPAQKVSFGTSGHRGTALNGTFTETHVAAISQAIAEYRKAEGISGPLYVGMDTHALSAPAQQTAVEVLAANQAELVVQKDGGYTPTPAISRAILTYNRDHQATQADGVVITPSHNPPEDGGFKYNPPSGGPAGTEITNWVQDRANQIIRGGMLEVRRLSAADAAASPFVHQGDMLTPYVEDLKNVVDMGAIARSGVRIGADPLGGSGIAYWQPIAERYGLNLQVVNDRVDKTFSFMPLDKDGKIRMDCSSPWAMANLVAMKDRFDIAFGNDVDFDRHGIVTPSVGLMNPNHYLAVAIWYLFQHRQQWRADIQVGKTLVSSSMIDRVTRKIGRQLCEVPVGFKWFVPGLLEGSLGFGGEESAGASFLRMDGTTWTTDKDGFIMDLLAAEILAVTGKDPGKIYQELEAELGGSWYSRMDAPANAQQKAIMAKLSPAQVKAETLAGDPITAKMTEAPCNHASIGGLKVTTDKGWFAARPSGTEDIYKIYAESLVGEEHLARIQAEAKEIVSAALSA